MRMRSSWSRTSSQRRSASWDSWKGIDAPKSGPVFPGLSEAPMRQGLSSGVTAGWPCSGADALRFGLCRLQRPAPAARVSRRLSGQCQVVFSSSWAPSSKSRRAGSPALLGQVRSRARFVALSRCAQAELAIGGCAGCAPRCGAWPRCASGLPSRCRLLCGRTRRSRHAPGRR